MLGKHVPSGNDNKFITCWYGNTVTMTTDAYILNFAV